MYWYTVYICILYICVYRDTVYCVYIYVYLIRCHNPVCLGRHEGVETVPDLHTTSTTDHTDGNAQLEELLRCSK